MGFKRMLPLLIIIAFMIFAASFLPQIMGSVEAGQDDANLSQEYKDQLNATKDVNIITISVTRYISLLLGVCALIGAAVWISKKK